MAKKKMSPKKSTKKPALRRQQASAKKKAIKITEAKKPIAKKKPTGARKIAKKAIALTETAPAKTAKKPISKPSPAKKRTAIAKPDEARPRGLGYRSAEQSGDAEGLSNVADADSESVAELVEEGQAFEAEAVSGVEGAPDPDEAEVTTKEVPEDDVPPEYSGEQ